MGDADLVFYSACLSDSFFRTQPRSERNEIVLSGFDRWKTEIAAIFVILLWGASMYLLSEWGSGYATAYDYYYYSDIWQEGGLPIYNMVMAGAITFISCLFFSGST